MSDLLTKRCAPCEGGVEPLTEVAAQNMLGELHPDWQLSDDAKWISREFEFPAFARTIAFVNAVAWIATTEGHHPRLIVDYGRCTVKFRTTAIDGLSENDFICAAKVDRVAADQ
ncbi:MAG: 4a-hydroxytetrahydrobiopterin dehydratase [Gammaproteobacteria bacterium]|nr:4a-hydroxytetrahydrobiopterin dehydratase [Gammaproteobacteria bacterium]